MMTRGRTRIGGLVLSLASGLSMATAADVAREPETYSVERYDVASLLTRAESGQPFTIRADGERFTLKVERNDVRSERFRAVRVDRRGARAALPERARIFKGSVVGDPGSIVRLSFGANGLSGYLKTRRGWTFIEPSSGTAQAARLDGLSEHLAYNDADIDPDFHGTCASHPSALEAVRAHASGRSSLSTRTKGAFLDDGASELLAPQLETVPAPTASTAVEGATLRVLEVAVVADHDYFLKFGAATTTQMESMLNAVEGIYEAELGLTIEIVSSIVWEEADDPYTTTTAIDLLLELRNYWNANRAGVARDVVHLFTGKNLDSSTVGIAYVGVVCDLSNAYSLSQDLNSNALGPLLVAHEIGHTLGALHDPADSTPRYVMYSSLGSQNLDEFSTASMDSISNYVAGTACLATTDGSESAPSGGGGGGGGPIDPLTLLALLGGAGVASLARRQRRER